MLLVLAPATVWAKPGEMGRETHPWGRFQPGAWKEVRVLAETFDEQGAITGTTIAETTTTLQKISDDGVTLGREVFVEIAGKRLDAEPQVVRQGFHGETPGQKTQVTVLPDDHVMIEGRQVPCHVEQVESSDENTKTVTKTYWSPTVAPFILKRESTTTDADGKVYRQSTIDVIALDMPRWVLGEIHSTSYVRTIVTHAKGTTSTLSITSADIPGGVICHTSKDMDEKGHLVCRSSLELIDYGLEPPNGRWGLLQRLRGRWGHRSAHGSSQ